MSHFTTQADDISTIPPIDLENTESDRNTLTNFNTIWFLFFSVTGITTNSLSLAVIFKQGLIKSSIWIYIASLCIADICTLISGFTFKFSQKPISLLGDILNRNVIACKAITALLNLSSVCSQYLLATMIVARCVTVLKPYKQPATRKQTVGYIFLIVIGMSLLYAPYISITHDVIEISLSKNSSQEIEFVCTVSPKYSQIYRYVVWIDMTIYFIIPLVIILISNFAIMFKLHQRSNSKYIQRDFAKSQEDIRITYMLIALSCFFILVMAPHAIYHIITPYVYTSPGEAYAPDNIIWAVIFNLQLTNFSCNMFLYVASGSKFRSQLKNFLKGMFNYVTKTDTSDVSNINSNIDLPVQSTSESTFTTDNM